MKPFRENELRLVIANQSANAHKKIDDMANEVIMANDLDVLADNIFQEFYIEPVTIFEEDFSRRSIKQGKIKKRIDPFFRNYYGGEFVEVDGIIADFFFPYTGDSSLFKCRASHFLVGSYPEISLNNDTVSFRIERSLSEMNNLNAKEKLLDELEGSLSEIKNGISLANNDVIAFNNSLKDQALKWLKEKRGKVEAYFSIATMFEVPIEKKEYAETHLPLKRNIVPVSKHYESANYYGISDKDYNDILATIKHTGSTYERTPASYKTLGEEDLRNTLLAALNATYKGDATGETFRHSGKTDICIERENRAAFVAECKMWTGQNDVAKAIEQLDGYLTWRDCKTALIYFVRRKDFLKTLDVIEPALRNFTEMRQVTILDKNEFACLFLSKNTLGQQINMRVLLFNLYYKE